MFSPIVTDHWTPHQHGPLDPEVEGLRIVVLDDELPPDQPATVLELAGGGGVVTLTSPLAAGLGLTGGSTSAAGRVLRALQRAGLVVEDPEHLFYLPLDEQLDLSREAAPAAVRQLREGDAELFARLHGSAPAADLDEAFVELDHWLVYGAFEGDRLVCAASMFPWRGTRLADLGVVTLPDHRGRGLARGTVRALSAGALARGYEPQYRCRPDNHPSIALAASAGFVRFGTRHVARAAG